MSQCYSIVKCSTATAIDADWNKSFWRDVETVQINARHWLVQSEHVPVTEVKLQYDDDYLYVIFRVRDCYVRAVASQINGDVWKDSCVEFFFAPDPATPDAYFNLETNCCGVLLAQCHSGPRQNSRFLDEQDCRRIHIAGSEAGPIRDEIVKPLTWTLEYAVSFELLSCYADIVRPAPGVTWRGNFYKCADDSSHPHWMAWSPIRLERPDFHRPEFFGMLQFV